MSRFQILDLVLVSSDSDFRLNVCQGRIAKNALVLSVGNTPFKGPNFVVKQDWLTPRLICLIVCLGGMDINWFCEDITRCHIN